ncbi:MAG: carboxylesterase/lipase family protein [Syntrophorhabdales bacterium]|jgi:para-nitrobenzyl esterase
MGETRRAIVETSAGKVEGRYQEGLFVFKGVPFAAPPVGPLRWMPPEAVKPWQGVRPAFEFGGVAPQVPLPPGVLDVLNVAERQDEDCLYLNVWTPGLDNDRRPVLVWIHGGAFNMGSGSQPFYEGRLLASRGNAVIVTINYRLGMLGFLNLETATRGRIPAIGNEGLLDQIAALRWVREDITAFGGDPGNVTVFGESAGGMSIGCLLAMPAARGLFHKAILESGVTVPANDADLATGERLLSMLGLGPSEADALRDVPVERLLAADLDLRIKMAGPGEPMRITVTAPWVDGKVLPLLPVEAARSGSAAPIPLLIGTNLEEWKLFGMMDPQALEMDESMMADRLRFFIDPRRVEGVTKAYRDARSRRGDSTTPFELTSAILSDSMFRTPALQMAEGHSGRGMPVYSYLFTWKSPALSGLMGACHALELGFVFGAYDAEFCGRGPDADRLSQCMQDAWLAFARKGGPTCPSLGEWPDYGQRRRTMLLGSDCRLVEAPYEAERLVWETLSGGPG